MRIPREGGVVVDLKWNQGIVFGLHQQRRYPNAIQELIGRLSSVIIVGCTESEGRRGEFIVEFVNAFDGIQLLQREQPRGGLCLKTDALLQTPEKTPGVYEIGRAGELPGTGGHTQ